VKKKLALIIAIIFIASLGVFFVGRGKPAPEPEAKKTKKPVVTSIDELPETDRPVISLSSRPDGKELTLEITNLKNFDTVEYELTYLTEGVQRGVIGNVDLEAGKTNLTRDLLLGTCSRGKCRYDTNVTGGTLTITFRGPKSYKFTQDFSLETQKGKVVVIME